jgi:hypothetical protein
MSFTTADPHPMIEWWPIRTPGAIDVPEQTRT